MFHSMRRLLATGLARLRHSPSARSCAVEAERALRAVSVADLDEQELCQLVSDMGQVKALADSVTVRTVRRLEALRAGSARGALVSGAQLSARDAHRLTKTAKQLDEMPNVSERLDAGDLTLDNLMSLGRAAQQCGASAVDSSPELLDRAASHDAGQFAGEAVEFARHHDPTRGEELLARQRKNRRGHLGIDAEGMGRITAETDPVSFALLRQAIDERRDHLWRQDGGRDGTPSRCATTASAPWTPSSNCAPGSTLSPIGPCPSPTAQTAATPVQASVQAPAHAPAGRAHRST